MDIISISDTHDQHIDMQIESGEILIHAGDISSLGQKNRVIDFLDWFADLPHKHKIFIAGNHDLSFDENKNFGTKPDWLIDILSNIPDNIHYLENESIELEGINFFGSPITPWFYGDRWAFNKHRGDEIKEVWNKIPLDTDVLITHGPPFGVFDYAKFSRIHVGCEGLVDAIERIKPILHIFGHIHEGFGIVEKNGTTFINASQLDENYNYVNNSIKTQWTKK